MMIVPSRVLTRAQSLVAIVLLAAACASQPALAQDYYKGKTLTLFAGQPPGGGIDSEMRLVAHYFGRFIPGEPTVIARNMQGAGGMVLGNHLYNVARPDGLTLGMPGRSGFVLAPVIGAGDVKYDLRKLTWIGSSASTNYILWLRRAANIRSLDALKAVKRQIVLGGSGAGTANSVVPEVLAKYEGFPFKVVRGYPGTNDAVLAMERGEVDGVFVHRASMRADLITSGFAVPIFQTFAIEPDLPVLERFVTNTREVALLDLLNAPQRLGLAVIAPPGLPADTTRTLRASYLAMVASREYQEEAARRGLDVGKPNTGEELAEYVASKLVSFPAETIKEYREYVERP
jgi:tripartite-type tricarboxylate transporter receptor subunit TctC